MIKKIKKEEAPSKIEFVTFRKPSSYTIHQLELQEPSCFNGIIEVSRWKVAIELIEEPKEILCERLLDLWEKCDNWHNREPLQFQAKKLGFELPNDSYGIKRKK